MGRKPKKQDRVVVALGGNALLRPGEAPTLASQVGNARRAMRALVPLVESGKSLVLTHGNGFQVGNILVRVEEALGKAYAIPLEMCVAESQGEIGYLLEQSLQNVLARNGLSRPVVSLLTLVLVDRKDPAFDEPTKPVGPYYGPKRAKELKRHGFPMVNQKGRGWRRVVASPEPVEIDDVDTIETLLQQGIIVIAAGGGGVPVVRKRNGMLEGVPAVIDKDLASGLLATAVGAPRLIILTGERAVFRDYQAKNAKRVPRLTIDEARRMAEDGQFPPGSMGPKVQAAIEFLERGGTDVLITSIAWLGRALGGRGGTWITRSSKRGA
ncbi:MAG: carbamate kinase [Planctomycetota bacterium]|nr:carbamate kinase [Planctomycetota bacterium]